MSIQTGTQAPDFTLRTKNADGLKDVSLSSFKGQQQVVLLFFPFAFTSVCQEELCSVSSGFAEYQALNAAVLGISVDSPFAQEAFAQAKGITIPLLSDFNRQVARDYDVLYSELLGFEGVAKRAAFVIDQAGKITFAWSSDDPHDLPPFDQIKSALGA